MPSLCSMSPNKYWEQSLSHPFIIPVFLPHAGCPHHCVFCNQNVITGAAVSPAFDSEIISSIQSWLPYRTPDRSPVQIAFFGGNFLGIETQKITRLLNIARKFVQDGYVDSIRFSTRPDTIAPSRLDLLADYPVSTIEIGVQSMNDTVLDICRRGHTEQDTVLAVDTARRRGYAVGIQMMTGLPGDNTDGSIASGLRIAALQPDFVRIYPTVVLDHSPLARWYRAGQYTPPSLSDSVSLVKQLYLIFHAAHIPVIRMGLQASTEFADVVLAGPFHPAFGHLVMAEIYRDRAFDILKNNVLRGDNVWIGVHPRRISVMQGLKKENIRFLMERLHLTHVVVEGFSHIADHQIAWRQISEEQPNSICDIF